MDRINNNKNNRITTSLSSSLTNTPNKTTSLNSNNLSDIQKYMLEKKLKRINDLKNEKEKQKREEDERKMKLKELYRKQRETSSKIQQQQQQQQHQMLTTNTKKTSSTPTYTTLQQFSKHSQREHQHRIINDDYLSTQLAFEVPSSSTLNNNEYGTRLLNNDMSKILNDKMKYLLQDNEKLIKQKYTDLNINSNNSSKKHQKQQSTSFAAAAAASTAIVTTNTNVSNSNEQLNKKIRSQSHESINSLTTITSSSSSSSNGSSSSISNTLTTGSSNSINNTLNKHDRLKKICSMALELQTQLQQTKVKLLGYQNVSNNKHETCLNKDNTRQHEQVRGVKSSSLTKETNYYKNNSNANSNNSNCIRIDKSKLENVTDCRKLRMLNDYEFNKYSYNHSFNDNNNDLIIMDDLLNDDLSSTTLNDLNDNNSLEKSFRQLLPSESHLKRNRNDNINRQLNNSNNCSFNNNFIDISMNDNYSYDNLVINKNKTNPRNRLSFEDDSFKKFTDEIVKKYMKEEELRSMHQNNLLKLREQALVEKSNAELSWLEQMKRKYKSKGVDDEKMPLLILKKEKYIIDKLKQEQDNIKLMKELNKKTSENRLQQLLKQQQYTNNKNDYITSSGGGSGGCCGVDYYDTYNEYADTSFNNQSINNSTILTTMNDSVKLKVKKHLLNSDKYLTQREKKLRLRRQKRTSLSASTSTCSLLIDNNNDNPIVQQPYQSVLKQPYVSLEIQNVNKEIDKKSQVNNHHDENVQYTCISDNLITSKSTSSGGDHSSTSSISSGTGSHSTNQIECKIKNLKQELTNKKNEVMKLKNDLNNKNKLKLKDKELQLKKQIDTYDKLIDKIKLELNTEPLVQEQIEIEQSQITIPQVIQKEEEEEQEQVDVEENKDTNNNNNDDDDDDDTLNSILSLTTTQTIIQNNNNNENKLQIDNKLDEDVEKIIHEADINFQLNKIQSIDKDVDESNLIFSVKIETINEQTRPSTIEIPILDFNEQQKTVLNQKQSLRKELCDNEKILFKIKSIDITRDMVRRFCDLCIDEVYWLLIEHHLNILNLDPPKLIRQFKFEQESSLHKLHDELECDEIESFREMLFNLIGQLLYDLYINVYLTSNKHGSSARDRQYFKCHFNGPRNKSKAKELVSNKLIQLIDFNQNFNLNTNLISKWKLNKYNRFNRDENDENNGHTIDIVDILLDSEMRQQEYLWCNYDLEVNEAKFIVCDSVFDYLLKDTLDLFKILI